MDFHIQFNKSFIQKTQNIYGNEIYTKELEQIIEYHQMTLSMSLGNGPQKAKIKLIPKIIKSLIIYSTYKFFTG